MNFFFKILIYFRFINIDEAKMNAWLLSKNKELILYTLKKGMFRERLLAIKALAVLKDEDTIVPLLHIAKTDYKEIARQALKAAQALDQKNCYQQEIEDIKSFWEKKLEKIANRVVSSVNTNWTDKSKRMKALENVRQQLKRPIGGGKWF